MAKEILRIAETSENIFECYFAGKRRCVMHAEGAEWVIQTLDKHGDVIRRYSMPGAKEYAMRRLLGVLGSIMNARQEWGYAKRGQ